MAHNGIAMHYLRDALHDFEGGNRVAASYGTKYRMHFSGKWNQGETPCTTLILVLRKRGICSIPGPFSIIRLDGKSCQAGGLSGFDRWFAAGNHVYDHLMLYARSLRPFLPDAGDVSVLNPVPFAHSRGEPKHGEEQPGLHGKPLELVLPWSRTVSAVAHPISGHQKGVGLGVQQRAHGLPPPTDALCGDGTGAMVRPHGNPFGSPLALHRNVSVAIRDFG